MQKTLSVLWCLIHFALEIICFQFYTLCFGDPAAGLIAAVIYDVTAFFPQLPIGQFVQRHPEFSAGKYGAVMVLAGSLTAFSASSGLRFAGLVLLSAGNAFVHVGGAEATLLTAGKRITPAAVFVSGGAFGVVTGRLLGASGKSIAVGLCVMLAACVLMPAAERLRKKAGNIPLQIRMADMRRNPAAVILLAFFVVTVRGMLAYGIPTAWLHTPQQTVLLFAMTGLGKAAGGMLSDCFGAKRTALLSTGLSVPLLLLGSEHMIVSLIGIALFSMTMASTLGVLVSVVPQEPLAAYGITTIGLAAGTLAVMLPEVRAFVSQGPVLTLLSALCFAALAYIMCGSRRHAP